MGQVFVTSTRRVTNDLCKNRSLWLALEAHFSGRILVWVCKVLDLTPSIPELNRLRGRDQYEFQTRLDLQSSDLDSTGMCQHTWPTACC